MIVAPPSLGVGGATKVRGVQWRGGGYCEDEGLLSISRRAALVMGLLWRSGGCYKGDGAVGGTA